jgi:hypothetical protein
MIARRAPCGKLSVTVLRRQSMIAKGEELSKQDHAPKRRLKAPPRLFRSRGFPNNDNVIFAAKTGGSFK